MSLKCWFQGLDMGRRLCIIGFCRSIEMLSDVVEDTVLEHGGEVCTSIYCWCKYNKKDLEIQKIVLCAYVGGPREFLTRNKTLVGE